MDIDIAPYIKEILYKHNNLVIPGFGNFVLKYASTTIDHVQGLLNPPAKTIGFDNNLITNDGRLLEFIKEKHKISSEEATSLINIFVSNIKTQLGKREMVTIPEVGRLYKDFENNTQFIPDATNFNKESFGLPTINFYPILRETTSNTPKSSPTPKKKVAQTVKAPISKVNNTTKKQQGGLFDYLKTNSWMWVFPIILLVAGIGTCIAYPKLTNKNNAAVIDGRVNQRPTKLDDDTEEIEDPREDIVDRQMEEEQEAEMIDTESITVNPNQKECVVSIGVYSIRENATKMIKTVYDKGFDAYRENFNRNGKEFTKVGVQFGYETNEEFNSKLKNIKRYFPEAVVLKK